VISDVNRVETSRLSCLNDLGQLWTKSASAALPVRRRDVKAELHASLPESGAGACIRISSPTDVYAM
jgi:hypothetical protein